MSTVVAVILARGGSRRLKNKHLRPFAGSSLLEHKISQLRKVSMISDIVVSSDSEAILSVAAREGAKTQLRPTEYADEQTRTFNEVVEFVTSRIEGEHILWAYCTSPLVDSSLYDEACREYFTALENGHDSLVSMERIYKYLWSDRGPVNFDPFTGPLTPKVQLPNLYMINDGIYIAPRRKMVEWRFFYGPKPYIFLMDKRTSVDVDDALDLAQARCWLDMTPNEP